MAESNTFEMAPFVEKASRLELIVRWFYGIVIGILFYLWGIYVSILHFLQFWHILIFGRRGGRLYRGTKRFLAASTYVSAYLLYLTDERPELTPDYLVFFKKAPAQPGVAAPVVTEAMVCSSCGTPLQPHQKFCPKCGTAAATPPPTASETKFCISCSAKLPAAAKFCGSCGTKQQ